MSGSVAAVGVVASTALMAVALATVSAAAVAGQRLAGAADAAAIAAADAASGAAAGVPCERADELAAANGGVLEACEVDGLIATVSVTIRFGPVLASDRARAGPPS